MNAPDIIRYWEETIFAPRGLVDQTRGWCRATVDVCLQDLSMIYGEEAGEKLLMAIDRYRQELPKDARPMGLTRFCRDPHTIMEHYIEGWQPPPKPAREVHKAREERQATNEEVRDMVRKYGKWRKEEA